MGKVILTGMGVAAEGANVWPATLPTAPLMEGNSESAPNTIIRTAMEVGPPKLRQRSTAGYYTQAYNFHMSKEQLDTLISFYITTCEGGALDFEFTHPRLATTQNFRFASPPSWNKITATIYRVAINLEMLP